MGDPVGFYAKDHQAATLAKARAGREFPADWMPVIDGEARSARPAWGGTVGHPVVRREVWTRYLDEFGGAAAADLSDGQIKARAQACATEARMMDIGELIAAGAWREYERLVNFCRAREVEPPPPRLLLKGMGARVRCQYWWRRALRRMVARKCERGALYLGLVSKPAGQPYASNAAVIRRISQNARNVATLAQTWLENEDGYRASVANLAAASVSARHIRRGELMTRIRGCEEIADACGNPGLFLTMTCPSRFHSTLRDGRRNPKYDGSTPRDGQEWLCTMFKRARAKLHRRGLGMYGFRVAEPHHDGCTHWHALFWFRNREDLHAARRILRAQWLSDAGDEPGAQRYRFHSKKMIPGKASGYVAKYVSKNIDDHAIADHQDDYAEGAIGPDLLGDLELKPSARVEAWAATWGIRQFQPIGQPPVTVWRELRRISEAEARRAGVGGIVHKAWCAAQRVGGVMADWARYVMAQGGMMRGRAARIVMRHDAQEIEGLYGRAVRKIPIGVALNLAVACTVWSVRRIWRAVEGPGKVPDFAPLRGATRTGFNNCTALDADDDEEALRLDYLRGSGGQPIEVITNESSNTGRFGRSSSPDRGMQGRIEGEVRRHHTREV